MTDDTPRLIERAFPLKQASLDSVHEKNVRHGHISTLHIWPARRPLAACRAALIATLLPDPGSPEKRKELVERIGGKIITKEIKKKLPNGKVKIEYKDETSGGVLHWGQESSSDMDWFREEIRRSYGGRAPRVLDPFAGGGAIPFEAMRLGCEVTAVDINPVAWFILKCTLEYPQKLAGQKRPLPKFAVESPEFMREYWKKTGKYSKKQLDAKIAELQAGRGGRQSSLADHTKAPAIEADLAWHVRAWGHWVLERARKDLEKYYPTVDGNHPVAYLWARTVTCKNCRATIPLLKTRWLSRKDKKRVLLTMEPNKERTGVVFGIQDNVPTNGGNGAQKREHDKRLGEGTMSRTGAWCPCCPDGGPGKVAMTMEDIRQEGLAGRLGVTMTAVVAEDGREKVFRTPQTAEVNGALSAQQDLTSLYSEIPFGLPSDPLPDKEALGIRVPLYGMDDWSKVFIARQLASIGTFVHQTRLANELLAKQGYPAEWAEAIVAYLAVAVDRTANYASTICIWESVAAEVKQTFLRFALPITWDFAEANPRSASDRYYAGAISTIGRTLEASLAAAAPSPNVNVKNRSAITQHDGTYDLVLTDPPYYDAIPYSDLMDFFYVWLRRCLWKMIPEADAAFTRPLAPKWDTQAEDGELVDDPSRFGGDKTASRLAYENGMFRAFVSARTALSPEGRLVIVFANKQPAAWETLVGALIRGGFVVDGSWPIATEMRGGVRNFGRASLASSVWLVCRKRPAAARPGWDNQVLEEMRSNIDKRLREFWDAGIRGPDFVWAATGPALEAYSKHPIVKKANEPGKIMTVTDFLTHVRRIVVNFVVGRVLSHYGNGDSAAAASLDEVSTYYLLHRHDFGFEDAPAGACILYAVSCGLSDSSLADDHDVLLRTGGTSKTEEEPEESENGDQDAGPEVEKGTGSTVRLKAWNQRTRKAMGYDANGKPAPLVDRVHRLMHLWRAGDVAKVDEFLEDYALTRNATFHQVLQALIELAKEGSEERSLLESLSNHIGARGGMVKKPTAVEQFAPYQGEPAGGKSE